MEVSISLAVLLAVAIRVCPALASLCDQLLDQRW
jgi:hypothetical protein